MNIFIVSMFYKDKQNAEKAIFVYEQARALALRGHNIIVLAVNPTITIMGDKHEIEYICDNGIHTFYIPFPQSLCSERDFSDEYLQQYVIHLDHLMRASERLFGKADVVYAHFSLIAGYAASILSDKYHYPIVIEEHHSRIMTDLLGTHDIEILTETVKNADEFICVSSNLKKAVLEKTGIQKKIHVISNMIDSSFDFYPRTRKNTFRFFALGNLFHRKGFDLLIKAFDEEFTANDSVELIIGGSGPEEMALKEQMRKLCNNPHIELVGHLSRAQTIEEYKKCDCFVLASRCESYGLVYREAMAVGRPVITTNHGGFSIEEWREDFGIMTDVDDMAQLRKALRAMYENYSSYDLRVISSSCLKYCSEKEVIDQIESILFFAAKKKKKAIPLYK